MKKNVKCNLLKSLFLTGTVLTVSACNKGDENNANTELQNEVQSLKQQLNSSGEKIKEITNEKDDIEKELDRYKEKARETEANDKKLLEAIKTEISTLTTIDNTIDFSKGLDNIKVLLEQISSDDTKSEANEYLTDYLKGIKFDFEKDDQDPALINFKCGNLCIESINYNVDAFYKYCYFVKEIMDIVGCDDNYKIDLSQYSEKWDYALYNNLKSFPKEYFSTAKTFSFDFDNTTNKFIAGWTDKISQFCGYEMNNTVYKLFFLYDINPDLVCKNFDIDDICFYETKYKNLENFDFVFYFKGKCLGNFFRLPISNFLQRFDFNCFNFNSKIITFLKSNNNLFLVQKLNDTGNKIYNLESFLNFLKSKNVSINKRPAIVLEADKICLKNPIGVNYTFDNEQCSVYEDLLYFLKVLNSLKDCNFIDVKEVSLDFGSDGNSLNLGNCDLLKFYFGNYNMFNKDVAYFLSLLFKLFDVDYTVKFDGKYGIIKLSTNEKTYSYKLKKNGYLKKV